MLAFAAMRSAVRSKGNALVAMVLGMGWALFAAGLAFESMDERMEWLAYLGIAVLILGHILNLLDIRWDYPQCGNAPRP